ncbi:MAG: hypothetical protein E7291_01570 [Lachnospiraceae bacterium]|nr:hypothetical protein [Lachnospiraceae bacterium]
MLDILITIICIILLIFIWVMLYDSNRFVVSRYTIGSNKIKKNVRAVILADLHNKCYGKDNERLLAAIEECAPDIILVAGDILTAKPKESMDTAIHLMKTLVAKYPIYYGSGNHEHRLKLYPEKYGDMYERYEKVLAEAGITWLVNSHVTLSDYGITIYGAEIDRFYYKRFRVQDMQPDYLKNTLGQTGGDTFNILLAHNPDYFPQYVQWQADFVCAGHVHGGMVRIPFLGKGVVSPNVRLFPRYDGGIYQEGNTTMLLSRGLGMHTIPIRIFNPGELWVVDFTTE